MAKHLSATAARLPVRGEQHGGVYLEPGGGFVRHVGRFPCLNDASPLPQQQTTYLSPRPLHCPRADRFPFHS